MSRLQRLLLLLASLMVSHHRTYPPHDRPLCITPRGILSQASPVALLLNIVKPLAGQRQLKRRSQARVLPLYTATSGKSGFSQMRLLPARHILKQALR